MQCPFVTKCRVPARPESVSAVAAAAPEEQARVESRVRALVREGEVEFPLLTSVIVSDRV